MSKSKPYLYFVSVLCVISLILPLFTAAAFPGGVKAEEPGVVKVPFDSAEDIKANFDSYYFDEPLSWRPGHAGRRVELTDFWKLENQCLINNNDSSDQSQMRGMSQLLYKTPYKNFELNIDFLYAANGTWISPIVGFGAQPGQFVTDADGIDAVYLADGIKPYFWGTGIENVGRNDHADGFDYTLMYDALPINAADWHHMKLVVDGEKIALYIDDLDPLFATDFTYSGGYIFLASCHGRGGFKNMTIEALPERTAVTGEIVEVPFDSAEDINRNFNSYYFDEPLSWRPDHAGRDVKFTDVWKLEEHCLINNNDSSDQSQMMGMSQLLYRTPYKNFELNIDFYTKDSWISPIVGFGAQPGQFVTDADGIDAVYLADGIKPYFWGTGIENVGRNDHADGFDYTLMYDALPINAADWHHMRLVVQDSTIAMYIDNYGPYFATDFSYKGGYIFLASCHGKGGFKNMTIKALPDTEMQGLLIGDDAAAKFENYYAAGAADTVPGEFAETAFDTNWELKDGTLIRKADADNGWLSNMAMLTYKERKYMNFSLEVDYYQSPYSASWAMVGFGAKETDEFYYKSETSTLAYTTQEGRRVLRGKGLAAVSGDWSDWYAFEQSYLPTYENTDADTGNEYDYQNNGSWQRWHHMRLVVRDGKVRMYIDGSREYMESALSDSYEGGYIYLAAGSNQARFKNLRIVDYDHGEIEITSIKETDELKDHIVNRGEGESLGLPEEIIGTDADGNEYFLPIEWQCDNYRSGKAGEFTFTGVLNNMPTVFKNPENLSVSCTVTNEIDYDPETTVKYYFDHTNDMKDFEYYYALYPVDNGRMEESTFEENWAIMDGSLYRVGRKHCAPMTYNEFEMYSDVASLLYTGQKFRNYEVSVKLRRGQDTWGSTMVTIGVKQPGVFPARRGVGLDVYDNKSPAVTRNVDGGIGIYIDNDNYLNIIGDFHDTDGWNDSVRYKMNDESENGFSTDYNDEKTHDLRIRVVNRRMDIFIDGKELPIWFTVLGDSEENTLQSMVQSSAEGYIGLTTCMNSGMYTELSITQLDYFGEPVKLGSEWQTPVEEEDWVPEDEAFGLNLTEWDEETAELPEDEPGGIFDIVNTGVAFPALVVVVPLISAFVVASCYKKIRYKRQ